MSNLLEDTETFNIKELHYLCDNGRARAEGVDRIRQWLITNKDDNDSMKAAMTYQGIVGYTAFHRLLITFRKYDITDIVKTFLKCAPEVVNMVSVGGSLPIHCANGNSLEVMQALISASPDSIKAVDDTLGEIPLHKAVSFLSNLDVLNLLIESYPKGIYHMSMNGETPLDILRRCKCAKIWDDQRMLPLHHACKKGYLYLIYFLIEAYPVSPTIQDNDGNTPLQYLTKTASCRDEKGMLLLHRQVGHSKDLDNKILNNAVDAYPEAIRVQDKSGLLPFHHACLNQDCPLDILISLITYYPECILLHCTRE